jgi:hypothetical protein
MEDLPIAAKSLRAHYHLAPSPGALKRPIALASVQASDRVPPRSKYRPLLEVDRISKWVDYIARGPPSQPKFTSADWAESVKTRGYYLQSCLIIKKNWMFPSVSAFTLLL